MLQIEMNQLETPSLQLILALEAMSVEGRSPVITGHSFLFTRCSLPYYVVTTNCDSTESLDQIFQQAVERGALLEERIRDPFLSTESLVAYRVVDLREEGQNPFIIPQGALFPFSEITMNRLCYLNGEWRSSNNTPDALQDYKYNIIRLIGTASSPETDLRDILSLAVYISRLNGELDRATSDLLAERAEELLKKFSEKNAGLSRRFLRQTLDMILTGNSPSAAFEFLMDCGLLEWLLPELTMGRGLQQNRFHKFDIYYHNLYTCDAVKPPRLDLRLAGLFHDLGKSETIRFREGADPTFYNHEVVSARLSDKILRRFGYPSSIRQHVHFLVRNHMFHYTGEWTDRAVRRFIKKIENSDLKDLIDLRMADRIGSGKSHSLPKAIEKLKHHIEEVLAREAELKVTDLAIDGNQLKELGLIPGPAMGDLLRTLLIPVQEGRIANDHTALKEGAIRWIQEHHGE